MSDDVVLTITVRRKGAKFIPRIEAAWNFSWGRETWHGRIAHADAETAVMAADLALGVVKQVGTRTGRGKPSGYRVAHALTTKPPSK